MIDQRLSAASSELVAATTTVTAPTTRLNTRRGPAVALASAVVALFAIGAVGVLSSAPETATDPTPAPVATPPIQSSSSTLDESPPEAPGSWFGRMHSLESARWTVADPVTDQERGGAALTFDPLAGSRHSEILTFAPVESVEAVARWFEVPLPLIAEPIDAVAIGEIFGFTVAKANRGTTVSACAIDRDGSFACQMEIDGKESGQTLSPDDNLTPVVWLVPEGTAAVHFTDHGNSYWMVPVEGVVAFPWLFPGDLAHLVAVDETGAMIEQKTLEPVVPIGADLGDLPGPVDIDVLRELARRERALIALGNETPSLEMEAPFGRLRSHIAVLGDGSTATLVIVGDDADHGFAILAFDEPHPIELLDPESPDDDWVITADDMYIVGRNVEQQAVVDWWNAVVDR